LVDEGGYLAAGDVAGGGKLLARGIVDRDFALCGGCYGVGGKTGNLSSIDINAQRIGIAAGKLQAVYQRYDVSAIVKFCCGRNVLSGYPAKNPRLARA